MTKFDDELYQSSKSVAEKPPQSGGKTAKSSDRIKLEYFNNLGEAQPKPWLIKNVIARGETSSWIAPPGKGKSALLTDIAVHLSGGKDWRDYRTKERAGALYFALERADLVKRRLTAHKIRDSLPNLPIAVAGEVINLMHESAPAKIVAAIEEAEQHFGLSVGLCIFDTYAKAIAAGGGDESAAKDQNAALANLRRVLDKKSVHIAGIGHTGKDETKGERGSNARLADVDVLNQIAGDTIKTVTVKKANDQQAGEITSFQLEPFEFGVDEDGDPFGTYILAQKIFAVGPAAERGLSARQQLALDALAEATLACGVALPPSDGLPRGLKAINADQWRDELYRRGVLDQAGKNPRARFFELRTQLQARRLIGVADDLVWRAIT
jgi:hypothetical protein